MSVGRRITLLAVGIVAGLTAAAVMILIMAAARAWLGISPPPEAAPDRLAPTLSIEKFFSLFGQYGGYNGLKQFGIKVGISALVGAGVLFGLLYALVASSARGRNAPRWPGGVSRFGAIFLIGAASVLWLGSMILLWPVLASNFRGLPPSQARWVSSIALMIEYALFGATLAFTFHKIAPDNVLLQSTDGVSDVDEKLPSFGRTVGRRAILATVATALISAPSFGLIRRLYNRATFDYDGRPYSGPGVKPIAPNDQFYTVTKNVVDPNISKRVWALEITGKVDSPKTYDFDQLVSLGAIEQETTLMCISNTIGAGLFSNAVWTGVPMAALLTASGVSPDAVEVKLHAADGYTDTFAIEKALDPTTMVVYLMNGDPLPERHGYPARVIVPGLFGEKNVKWVTGIEVIDYDGQGFYEQQGWGPSFVIPTRSDIFAPQWRRGSKGDAFVDPFNRNRVATIKGRAFGGNRGIRTVEVSVDGGESWNPATIDYPGTRLTWTFWSYRWTPTTVGDIVVLSRAVDGEGGAQSSEKRGIVAQGATGYHKVTAHVL